MLRVMLLIRDGEGLYLPGIHMTLVLVGKNGLVLEGVGLPRSEGSQKHSRYIHPGSLT